MQCEELGEEKRKQDPSKNFPFSEHEIKRAAEQVDLRLHPLGRVLYVDHGHDVAPAITVPIGVVAHDPRPPAMFGVHGLDGQPSAKAGGRRL